MSTPSPNALVATTTGVRPARNSSCVLWRALRAIEPWYGFAGTPSSVNAAASSSERRRVDT
ncbi:hypothetical protein RM423_14255 [Jatrophihabitans sp. DSM 44399]|uniref:Uncharacterized protein n=1 Tax=Jatrophihabitans lederbergiae TaxID=3075547 RepID=A0ABU2JC38_9ACTN|nr:hypothetical protein [Jatrophihabitans sp. DSM 44399]MDT0262555.1 hypothetical protein [Jatrophihabitans sp. DSM 44399]